MEETRCNYRLRDGSKWSFTIRTVDVYILTSKCGWFSSLCSSELHMEYWTYPAACLSGHVLTRAGEKQISRKISIPGTFERALA